MFPCLLLTGALALGQCSGGAALRAPPATPGTASRPTPGGRTSTAMA